MRKNNLNFLSLLIVKDKVINLNMCNKNEIIKEETVINIGILLKFIGSKKVVVRSVITIVGMRFLLLCV